MELKFIGQGLDPDSNITAGDFIINSLERKQYNSFSAFVAFVSTGGLKNIIDHLVKFKERGGTVRLYLGVDLNATSKEALEQLLEHDIDSYVVYSPNNIIYHPKIYAFEGKEVTRVIIGSSNFTESGLFQNVEASVCIDFENDDEYGRNFIDEIYDHFNSIISLEHQSCQKLTPDILTLLIENKIVLPEVINRVKNNKINQEFRKKDPAAYAALLEYFGKLKQKKPPKGFKKVFTKAEIIVEKNKKINIVNETIELPVGSMWIETGRMTGGSKNQLDMSKKGKHEGELIRGSVSYFGLDPDDVDASTDIDIELGGKVYKVNPIFYTPGNSNWRIQLKGVTDDGEKLTSISRIQLGQDGGFVSKILLFTKINETNYKLEILDLDDRDKLIENSSVWGKMGNETTGRAYGFI